MVHASNGSITQNLDSSYSFERRWTKNVIDSPIVDCRIARRSSQIAKVTQDVTVRLAIVFQVVSIEICLIARFEFKVEITGNENLRRLRSSLRPIYQRFSVGPSASRVERISMCAQEQHFVRAAARLE